MAKKFGGKSEKLRENIAEKDARRIAVTAQQTACGRTFVLALCLLCARATMSNMFVTIASADRTQPANREGMYDGVRRSRALVALLTKDHLSRDRYVQAPMGAASLGKHLPEGASRSL